MRLPKSDDNTNNQVITINQTLTTTNSNFTTSELVEYNETKGRKYLKQIANNIFPTLKKLSFSDNKFARWDSAVQTEDDSRYMIEIKCRNMDSTKYKDYMIEEKKLQFLIEKAAEGYIPLYINFFEDGKCLVWDLRYEMESESRDITCNRVTVNPNAGKVTRKRLFLKRNNSAIYDYIRDVEVKTHNEDMI